MHLEIPHPGLTVDGLDWPPGRVKVDDKYWAQALVAAGAQRRDEDHAEPLDPLDTEPAPADARLAARRDDEARLESHLEALRHEEAALTERLIHLRKEVADGTAEHGSAGEGEAGPLPGRHEPRRRAAGRS